MSPFFQRIQWKFLICSFLNEFAGLDIQVAVKGDIEADWNWENIGRDIGESLKVIKVESIVEGYGMECFRGKKLMVEEEGLGDS